MLVKIESASSWAEQADVVVVGAGMAGMCAAIEARRAGADVLVLERAAGAGGSSALAGGHFYLGGGTPVQVACGIEDSAEEMFKYLVAVSPEPNEDILRTYCDNSVAHFEWLEAQGVPFERSYHPEKTVLQPGKDCLIWSGNENVWPYRNQAKPAPRGHKVAENSDQGGALAMRALTRQAEALGVRFSYNCRATGLIIDQQQRVIGVRIKQLGEERDVRGSRGIVLATGGFNMNQEMIARYVPHLAQVGCQGTPNDDGSGIQLGAEAGGQLLHMDGTLVTSPIYPPPQLLKGILVNNRGERFVAEDSYHGRSAALTLEQPERVAYLIVDSEIFDYPHYKLQELVDGWETIAEMEAGLKLPAGSLQKTMSEYNEHAQRGEDPTFHKHPDWVKPLTAGPYAAFDLTFGKAQYLSGLTLGGLRVTADAEVLREDGSAIAGLYAAGGCASLVAQDCKGYSSGTCLGQASFFGRRAGSHAAAR